tara:strand:+ start:4078 stop:4470 length:393 start_codon:yes stop_codon:yes gene_type:complete
MIYTLQSQKIILNRRSEKRYSPRYRGGAKRTTPRPSIVHQQDLAALPNNHYPNRIRKLDKKLLRYSTNPHYMSDIGFSDGITGVESDIEYKRNSITLPRIFSKAGMSSNTTYRTTNYNLKNPSISQGEAE